MITRVRFEAKAESEIAVREDLLEHALFLRASIGDEWEQEAAPEILSAKKGYWGHYTIKRIDHQLEEVGTYQGGTL